MKKTIILFFVAAFSAVLHAESSIAVSGDMFTLKVGEKMETAVEQLGVPDKITVYPWKYNRDYDKVYYNYKNNALSVLSYKKHGLIREILIFNTDALRDTAIILNGVTLKFNEKRAEIERKLDDKGSYWNTSGNFFVPGVYPHDNHRIYIYGLGNFLDAHLIFDEENRLQGVVAGMQEP